jgi:hypothetical protein
MAVIQVLGQSLKGNGLNAPKLTKIDKIESAGSLLLLDMSKNAAPTIATNSTSVSVPMTNLFEQQSLSITGASTSVLFQSRLADNTVSRLERTAKGGLYFLSKHAVVPGTYPSGNYMSAPITGGVFDWIRTHFQGDANEHQFYFSSWVKHPEYVSGDLSYVAQYSNMGNHNNERVFFFSMGGGSSDQPIRFSFKSTHGLGTAGAQIYPTAFTPFIGFSGGWSGLNTAGSQNKRMASIIFYRFYVEDLTISGRTKEQLDVIDQQLFDQAFSPGGKFYGDTYTSPTILG